MKTGSMPFPIRLSAEAIGLFIFMFCFMFCSLNLPTHAIAASSTDCAPTDAYCPGDTAYFRQNTGEIRAGVVTNINDTSVEIEAADKQRRQYSTANVASTNPARCSALVMGMGKLCPGDGTQRSAEGKPVAGVALAVFPSGELVVFEKTSQGERTGVFKRSELDVHKLDNEENTDLLKALADFDQLTRALRTELAPACPTCAAQAAKADKLKPDSLTRRSSWAQFLLNNPRNLKVKHELGAECTALLTHLYASGRTLFSPEAVRQSVKVKDFQFPTGGEKTDFFHYTDSKGMLDQFHPEEQDRAKAHELSLRDGTYERAFLWPKEYRGDYRMGVSRGFGGVIYVAEDPISSSKGYGKLRVTFHLNPEARIIQFTSDEPTKDNKRVYADVERKFPRIFDKCNRAAINYLILEDSGIDLIDYIEPGNSTHHQYFHFLRPNAIERTELKY